MARTTSRKDPIASFIWTVGAADMVIGGVGERGSLFALGLLTVGAGFLVRWLRQQRYERSVGAWRDRAGSSFPAAFSAQSLSAKARDVSVVIARRLRSSGVTRTSRYSRGYSAAARPGFRANSFVNSAQSQPRRNPSNPPSRQRATIIPRSVGSQSLESRPRVTQSDSGLAQDGTANRNFQGPPLNLPPAPRTRARRGRRIY